MKTPPLLIGIAVCFGNPAFAGDPPPLPEPPAFSEVDADGDRLVTEEEFRSFMEQRMAEREGQRRPPGGRFSPVERADADGDGALNEQEFEDMLADRQRMREHRRPPRD